MYQLSFYNYYVNNGDRTIYFNSISGQIFSVSEQEHIFLQNQFNDLISFELEYNSVFKKFVDWEFITGYGKGSERCYSTYKSQESFFG